MVRSPAISARWIGAAPRYCGNKRRMNIDRTKRCPVQQLLGQQLTVSNHHQAFAVHDTDMFHGFGGAQPLRLEDRNPKRLSQYFDGRRSNFPAAALGSIRLGHHQANIGTRVSQ